MIGVWGGAREKSWSQTYIQAMLALYGSILMWLGFWDLLTEGKSGRHDSSDGKIVILPITYTTAGLQTLVGVLTTVFTDSLYANAGLSGNYWPQRWLRTPHRPVLDFFLKWLRTILGLGGMFAMWTGLYDLIDHTVTETVYKDLILIAIGFVGNALSGTFFAMIYLYPAGEDGEDAPYWGSSFQAHAVHTLRSLFALFFQNCIWVGGYNLMEAHFEDTTLQLQLVYVFGGLSAMLLTSSLIANSWIEVEVQESDPEPPLSLTFILRSLLSVTGQVVNNTGFWTLLEEYTFEASLLRNILFGLSGFVILVIVDCAHMNAGTYVASEEDLEGEDGLGITEGKLLINDQATVIIDQ
eukprot:UC1_evm2s1698